MSQNFNKCVKFSFVIFNPKWYVTFYLQIVCKCLFIVLNLFANATTLFCICFNLQRLRRSFRRSDGVHQRVVVRSQLHADEQAGRRRHPDPQRIQQRLED
jgi:hypothetical protein